MTFEKINNIGLTDSLWRNKIFLTFDVDWASEEIIKFTTDLLEEQQAKATFFVTHSSSVLKNLPSANFELGIHPNFNFLLAGDFRYGKTYKEVIAHYKDFAPEAVSVRSHSMVQSTLILDEFVEQKIKFDANTFVPLQENKAMQPWTYWKNELIKVPYIWEDDVQCMYNRPFNYTEVLQYAGIKVLDFHPIHIFLNTEKIERYEAAKPHLQNYHKLKEYINTTTYGARNFLLDIIKNK